MDVLRPVRAFDTVQQRHRWLAIPMAVLRKFGDDQAGSLASLVAYYLFFSLFPLLLVFTTILGFVLQGNPGAQSSIEHSVLGQFPVIGTRSRSTRSPATRSRWSSAWSWRCSPDSASPRRRRTPSIASGPCRSRTGPTSCARALRGLALLASLGSLFVVATGMSGLVTGLGGPFVKVGAIGLSLAVNFGLYLAAFRFLTAATIPTRSLCIGVAFAAVFLEILQLAGGIYINHVWRHASAFYSQFALVIALLVWLHLVSQLTLYAAEVNVVVSRRLWPRSLLGPPDEPADRRTLTALAKVEERHDDEQIDVKFDDR